MIAAGASIEGPMRRKKGVAFAKRLETAKQILQKSEALYVEHDDLI
jgi:hypothetical protein